MILLLFLLVVAPIVGFCVWSGFCDAVLNVISSFAFILLRKRELIALLRYVLAVMWLSVSPPRSAVGWYVIVAIPVHTDFSVFLNFTHNNK